MNELNELVNDAKLRFKHQESKTYLKEKYKGRLVVPFNGGLFTANMELMAFLSTHVVNDHLIVLDDYSNPIQVSAKELYKALLDRYHEVMQEWYTEYSSLSRLR